ncbi:PQQ-dependent sugar dehydrogenase [Streptomyces fuscigenes]|uniref:PQQ-dependent sugar dehydrogenase n=1 Tax=Streptomyces fuscigenes TaxID=1528880 RepID=UPI001F44F67D|nr:PQQ-dependent sugar dehydrogenase [Streptomyces fuscigenes]MCF3961236.1 PQQ-dependent sugar dehydrogenase [Streptomyces fuscigenes]
MRRTALTTAAAAVALLVATGCSGSGPGGGPGSRISAPATASSPAGAASGPAAASPSVPPAKGSVRVVSTLTENLKSPWGLAALPGGDLLVSSRDEGTITRVDVPGGKKTEAGKVSGVSPAGEGGLLGIAVSPSFARDHLVYAYFTTASDNRIARMTYDPSKPPGEQLGAPDTILRGIPKGFVHNGGRIAFGPDGMLYAGTGESGATGKSQDKASLGGKILRMKPDGSPAPGNPDKGSVVYDLGHRNVQGLAWDSSGQLWASEFGQDTWDELNRILPGRNYGWPKVEGKGHKQGFMDPLEQWHTDEASPSGIAYVDGSVWMAALRGERLWRIPLDGRESAGAPQSFLKGKYGRLRTVLSAGGDKLWLVTSNTDTRGKPKRGDDRILLLQVR